MRVLHLRTQVANTDLIAFELKAAAFDRQRVGKAVVAGLEIEFRHIDLNADVIHIFAQDEFSGCHAA